VVPRIQQVGGTPPPKPFRTRFDQNAHTKAPDTAGGTPELRMGVILWCSGWWNETLEMLKAFASMDGIQMRRIVITDTEQNPIPREVVAAAQQAFKEVWAYRTQFVNERGFSAPRALMGAAGFINERLRHQGPLFFTLPMIPVGPGSLDRLEYEHQEGVRAGRKILGQVVGEGDNRQPYGSFVTHREWIYDPNFPLALSVGLSPESMSPMKFMRLEMLRSFRMTNSLLCVPGLAPDRATMLKAFNLTSANRELPLAGKDPTPSTGDPLIDEISRLITEANEPLPEEGLGVIEPQEHLTLEPMQQDPLDIAALCGAIRRGGWKEIPGATAWLAETFGFDHLTDMITALQDHEMKDAQQPASIPEAASAPATAPQSGTKKKRAPRTPQKAEVSFP